MFLCRKFSALLLLAVILQPIPGLCAATAANGQRFWVAVNAPTKIERTKLSNAGISIESIVGETSYAFVGEAQVQAIEKLGFKIENKLPASTFLNRDFPSDDSEFHNFDRLVKEMQQLAASNPKLVTLYSIGKTVQNRDIWALRISAKPAATTGTTTDPGIVFMGGHHAREHVSVEVPFLLAKYLVENSQSDANIARLLQTREIFILPQTNPDGSEYDINDGSYHMWRKNMSVTANASCPGVDLNRNYGFQWGTGGSSTDECSEIYMGPKAFSAPETQVIKAFVEAHPNLKILLTFHTFSELILYPWGHTYDPITNGKDLSAYETMAKTMAAWNGYTPEQSSALYIASGDTTDWSYGTLGIFSFTFELSPSEMGNGGFYPGEAAIDPTFRANLKPALYLIDLADNPYRAVTAPQTTLFYGN